MCSIIVRALGFVAESLSDAFGLKGLGHGLRLGVLTPDTLNPKLFTVDPRIDARPQAINPKALNPQP